MLPPFVAYQRSDTEGGSILVITFPDPDDSPAFLGKLLIGLPVPRARPRKLVRPPLRVRATRGALAAVSMPETAVAEDGDSRAKEDDVSLPSQ